MPETRKSAFTPEQVRQVMQDWETYKTPYDPDFARTYAGEWVVLYRGQVVAHGKNGTEVARAASVEKYPGAEMFHVPTLDKQNGVWLLGAVDSGA